MQRFDLDDLTRTDGGIATRSRETNQAGVSWPAVLGGAFAIASLSLALLSLGTGLGFASVSVWANRGVSSSTVGAGAIIWLLLMQVIGSSAGGYLAGRLRTKWFDVHVDEVYFRDTAHGFLAWAVAFVITATALMSAATAMTGSAVASGGASNSSQPSEPASYLIDSLFRGAEGTAGPNANAVTNEVSRIFTYSLQAGGMSAADSSHISQMISLRTGLSRAEADRRTMTAFDTAQRAAEEARKLMAKSMLWGFVGLLIGAFCASVAATFGGRARDCVTV